MKALMLAGMTLLWAAAADAQPRGPATCEEAGAGLWSIDTGENGNGIRTFYDGQVTVIALNLIEPAAAPGGVAIVMPGPPNAEEPTGPECFAFVGYDRVDVAGARSHYDPTRGLILTFPTWRFDEARQDSVPAAPLRVRIDVGRGTVDVVGQVNR